MSHQNKKSLRFQVIERFDQIFTPGRSKYCDRKDGDKCNRIYSYSTLRNYKKHCLYFVNWVKQQPVKSEIGHRPRTIIECRPYVEDWLQSLIGRNLSAWSVKLSAAAMAKLFGCKIGDFAIALPIRYRKDIIRSRGARVRDTHFSETNNRDFVDFCRATGLRRHELMLLRGSDLIEAPNNMRKISVRSGKGGRPRESMVYSADPSVVDSVIEIMKAAGNGLVWPHLPSGADIHSYRSQYATAIYRHFARPTEKIPRYDRYYCRGDLAGVCYDRCAMKIASEQLGHSRIGVIAASYLREDK